MRATGQAECSAQAHRKPYGDGVLSRDVDDRGAPRLPRRQTMRRVVASDARGGQAMGCSTLPRMATAADRAGGGLSKVTISAVRLPDWRQ